MKVHFDYPWCGLDLAVTAEVEGDTASVEAVEVRGAPFDFECVHVFDGFAATIMGVDGKPYPDTSRPRYRSLDAVLTDAAFAADLAERYYARRDARVI